ncbi:MAG: hypothetical protein H0W84_13315, partial [Bacteroidetes bacterium]|nr:hypothetical protein [Bacteroidota bacterium]
MKANILFHTYYGDLSELFGHFKFKHPDIDLNYFVNVCSENISSNNVISDIKKNIPNVITTCTPNIGKDIGGKLVLVDLAMNLNPDSDFYIILHDKKSPHTT